MADRVALTLRLSVAGVVVGRHDVARMIRASVHGMLRGLVRSQRHRMRYRLGNRRDKGKP